MKRKELINTFMTISNLKNPLVSMVYIKAFQHFNMFEGYR